MNDKNFEYGRRIGKISEVITDVINDMGVDPFIVAKDACVEASLGTMHKHVETKDLADFRHKLRLHMMSSLDEPPLRNRSMALHRKIHPKTQELIDELETVTARFYERHGVKNFQPMIKAYSHLLHEMAIAGNVRMRPQTGLRGVLLSVERDYMESQNSNRMT